MTVIPRGRNNWNYDVDAYLQEIIDGRGTFASLKARFDDDDTRIEGVTDEVTAARGTASDLSTRLGRSMNLDGTLKSDAPVRSWWTEEPNTITYVNAYTFTVADDLSSVYIAGLAIRATVTAGTVYAHVNSASYDSGANKTTVILDRPVLDSGLSKIEYGQDIESSPRPDTAIKLAYFLGGV